MDDHHAQLWRARATAVRHSPLKPLAAQLGYHKDPLNRARWKRPGSVLSITGSKFFDHCCGQGGGGAIDLVMHAQGCCFTQAVRPPVCDYLGQARRCSCGPNTRSK